MDKKNTIKCSKGNVRERGREGEREKRKRKENAHERAATNLTKDAMIIKFPNAMHIADSVKNINAVECT